MGGGDGGGAVAAAILLGSSFSVHTRQSATNLSTPPFQPLSPHQGKLYAMRRRALLVTLDAWKTLFTPREAIATQYARVARQHGVIAKESDIATNFEKGKRIMLTGVHELRSRALYRTVGGEFVQHEGLQESSGFGDLFMPPPRAHRPPGVRSVTKTF